MVICGHIHGAFGISEIEYDGMQDITEKRQMQWGGYGLVEIVKILWAKITAKQHVEQSAQTLVVNAAFALSWSSSEDKGAIVVDLGLCLIQGQTVTGYRLARASKRNGCAVANAGYSWLPAEGSLVHHQRTL
jgi:hypothetical protein